MKNGDNPERSCARKVDDQLGIHRNETNRRRREISPQMTGVRKVRQVNELAADDGFYPIRGFLIAFLFQVTPDLH